MNSRIVILAAHVERLYDDSVWSRFERICELFYNRNVRLTLFVYPPLHSRHTTHPSFGKDGRVKFESRLKQLISFNHEIQLHSHFYKPGYKETDLSVANIHRVLKEESEYLKSLNVNATGFVAGAWQITDDITSALPEYGIKFDCSQLQLKQSNANGLNSNPIRYLSTLKEKLAILPTTDTLRSFLFSGCSTKSDNYKLIYFHDYDVVANRVYLFLLGIASLLNKKNTLSAESFLLNNGFYEK